MNFNGTIIITDPCYITTNADYERTNYGSELDKLGFTTFLVADTGFGDWSNHIIKDNGEELGEFCADSGQVCVVLKDEVAKYNPNFLIEYKSHCYATVENFEGEVEIDTSNPDWTVITGQGNINFTSDVSEEECNGDYDEE